MSPTATVTQPRLDCRRQAFTQGDLPLAISLYTEAITLMLATPGRGAEDRAGDAVLYSNRSLARLKAGQPEGALEDADACLAIDRKFVKGRARR